MRAARAYLDVCFFHPFDDGNSRMARLLLDFVLTRDGMCLSQCEPLFNLPRPVDDMKGHAVFVEVLSQLLVKAPPEHNAELEGWARTAEALVASKPTPASDSLADWFRCRTSAKLRRPGD